MTECDVNDIDNFEGRSQAQRLAEDIFSDEFMTYMYKTHKELDPDFKMYLDLTQAQGQIRIAHGIKKNIHAFVQWSCDEYHLGHNLQFGIFSADDTQI